MKRIIALTGIGTLVITGLLLFVRGNKALAAVNCYDRFDNSSAVIAYECNNSDAFLFELGGQIDPNKCYVAEVVTSGGQTNRTPAKAADCAPLRFADAVLPKCFSGNKVADCSATVKLAQARGKPLQAGKCYRIPNALSFGAIVELDCNRVAPPGSIIRAPGSTNGVGSGTGGATCPPALPGCPGYVNPSTGQTSQNQAQVTTPPQNPLADANVVVNDNGVVTNGVCGAAPNEMRTAINIGCKGKGNAILDMAFAIIRFLSIGVGFVLVGSLIVAGIQYSSARGDPQAVAQAIKRVTSLGGALLLYIFTYAILNWLIPAGLLR